MRRKFPNLFFWLLFLPLAIYILYPIVALVRESLLITDHWSLSTYFRFFDLNNPTNLRALAGSVNISLLSVLLSALIGIPLAIFFARFDFPGRKIFGVLATMPLLLPPLVGTLAFYFLMGESGILPRLLQGIFQFEKPVLVASGVPAILLVHSYTMYPFFYLFTRNALSNTDRSLEEAAANLGANRWRIWNQVIFPQLIPAISGASLLVFMNSMASFTAPYLFGGEWRFLTLEIYNAKLNGDVPMAITHAVVLTAISLIFLALVRWSERKNATGTGSKGVAMPPRMIRRGIGRNFLAALGAVLIFILLLPQAVIVMMALVRNNTWTYKILPEEFTFENFTALLAQPRVAEPLINSIRFSTIATMAGVVIGLLAAFYLRPRRSVASAGGGFLDALVMLPWAIPGTVMAMALIVAFDEPHWFTGGAVLVGTSAMLPLAYFVRNLPLHFRATNAAFVQFDPALEEAAMNLGAAWWLRFRRVTLPIILPGIATGAMMAFVTALGEFVASILLYNYSNRPLSIAIFSELRIFNLGTAAAYSVVLILLIGLVIWLTQKWIGERGQSLSF
jgi:iron(III) transport system permease protein